MRPLWAAARVGMTDTADPLRGRGLSLLLSSDWRRAYLNYLAPSSPERIREIYSVNCPRLARIKARHDVGMSYSPRC